MVTKNTSHPFLDLFNDSIFSFRLVQDSAVISRCTVWQIPLDSSHDEPSSPTVDDSSNQLHQPLRKRFDLNVPNSNMIE